jgi:hypothetical protein
MPPDDALLRAALACAGHGWNVFPCTQGGKRPALRGDWQDLATTDLSRIHQWWDRYPYNIGIACGTSGLAVLDLDVPCGTKVPPDQAAGADVLIGLCRQQGQQLPATLTVRTPSGGRHLYFTDPGTGLRNSAGRLGPLIDVRATGGYVVAPGSRIDGRSYEVIDPTSPTLFPAWIAALLQKADTPPNPSAAAVRLKDEDAYGAAALRDEVRIVATAVEHTRNDTLNRAAFKLGQLVGAGQLEPDTVSAALAEAAAQAGLPEREASRTIRSGMTAGARSPRQPRQHARAAQPPPPAQRPRGPVQRR